MHVPVMSAEVIDGLALKSGGIYLDCTFGRGGHSAAILQQLGTNGALLAFDRDLTALQSEPAKVLLEHKNFSIENICFSGLTKVVESRGWLGAVDGVLFDLGVSSPQLDNPERGFSFLKDGPLDMRMDAHSGITAAQWLATAEQAEIARVLFEYGEERYARKIAAAIVHDRVDKPFLTTLQLAEMIARVVPVRDKFKHPATRSFQALRIEINQELKELQTGLAQAIEVLKPGGRLVVIAFHSLEDRIVKRLIRDESRGQYQAGRHARLASNSQRLRLKKVAKAKRANGAEIERNRRARSAVLRIAERLE